MSQFLHLITETLPFRGTLAWSSYNKQKTLASESDLLVKIWVYKFDSRINTLNHNSNTWSTPPIWPLLFEGYLNIPGEDGVAGLVVSLTSVAYYGTMAGCYVPGIPSTYANKLYKVSAGYSGCRGICLSKCSQDNRLTKTKQKRVSTLQIGQIYRQFGWRWDYSCSIYMSFARLLRIDIKCCFLDLDM